ncbi:MAG: hypothetical protein ABL921_27305 [Pirellula sp.]
MSGNASMTIQGSVQVNSSCSSNAVTVGGNARISASQVRVFGGVRMTGNAQISPTPLTGAPSVIDPYAALDVPAGVAATSQIVVSGNTNLTVLPGSYTKITASGNATLTFQPGVYIIDGGGFSISGNASVFGNGVLFYNAGSNYPNPGGSFGSIAISGNGTYDLTAPTSGMYSGMTFFQARDNTQQVSVSGNASGMNGLLYAPQAQLVLSGNGQLQMSLVVDRLSMTGRAAMTVGEFGSDIHFAMSPSPGQVSTGSLQIASLDAQLLTSIGQLARRRDAIATNTAEFGTLEVYSIPLLGSIKPRTVLDDNNSVAQQNGRFRADLIFAELGSDSVENVFNDPNGEIGLEIDFCQLTAKQ